MILPAAISDGDGQSGCELDFAVPLPALCEKLEDTLGNAAEGLLKHGIALKPSHSLIAALEAATILCSDDVQRKAVMSAIFLFAGVFRSVLFRPLLMRGDGEARPPPFSLGGFQITVHTPTLPVGAGLGSSAAFSVATAAALLQAFEAAGDSGATIEKAYSRPAAVVGPPISVEDASRHDAGYSPVFTAPPRAGALESINDWAFCAEMLFHGTPSGLDNTVAT